MENQRKKIVFYCGFPPPLILYKIGRSLREKRYKVILFTVAEKNQINYEFNKQAFDKIIYSDFQFSKKLIDPRNLWKIPKLINFFLAMKVIKKPYAVIGLAGNNWQLKLAHKYFFKKHPFIYFPYDILSLFHKSKDDALKAGVKEFELNAEKYCFEKSDGIIHKGDPNELGYLNEGANKDIKPQKLQLSFMPYCSKEFSHSLNKDKISKKDKEIHLVYPGFILDISKHSREISESLNNILNQGIHIHLYSLGIHLSKKESGEYFGNTFKKFLKNKYFHMHKPVSPKNIVKEISKYDFGFYWSYIFDIPEMKLHIGTKIATFMEAELPIIYHEDCIFIDRLIKSYKIGISYNKENLKNLKKHLKKLNLEKLKRNTKLAKKHFDIDKNIPRLEEFLKIVVKSKNNKENFA